jgi:hypothetical protein
MFRVFKQHPAGRVPFHNIGTEYVLTFKIFIMKDNSRFIYRKDNSRLVYGLVIGALAGIALAAFISSEKGQEIMEDVKDATGKAGEGLKKNLERFEEKLSKGKEFAMDLEKKAGNFIKQRTS